jgi:hypothetical protein
VPAGMWLSHCAERGSVADARRMQNREDIG